MKKRLLSLLIGCMATALCYAQAVVPKSAEEIRQYAWVNPEAEFRVTEIPEKWKNESAVIIAQSYRVVYRIINDLEIKHKRVKLLDKAAVEAYSEFELPTKTAKYGFKVIKPDGKEFVVDLDAAVVIEKKVNAKYNYKIKHKKLAIPNLAPGDIIDFYTGVEGTHTGPSSYIFSLVDEYPIMFQRFYFDLLPKVLMNFKSLQGAPELTGYVSVDGNKHYSLTDENREKRQNERYSISIRSLPAFKVGLLFVAYMREQVVPTVTPDLTIMYLIVNQEKQAMVTNADAILHTERVRAQVKKYYQPGDSLQKLVELIYYGYRQKSYVERAEAFFLASEEQGQHTGFIHIATTILDEYAIPYDYCFTISRSKSTIYDIVSTEEVEVFLRLRTNTGAFIYLFTPRVHSLHTDIPFMYQGVEYKFLDRKDLRLAAKKKLERSFDIGVLPVIAAEDNAEHKKIHVQMDMNDPLKLTVAIQHTRKAGILKELAQFQFLCPYDYLSEEGGTTPIRSVLDNTPNRQKTAVTEKISNRKEEYQKQRLEELKEEYEEDMQVKINEVKDFSVESSGRMPDKPDFVYGFTMQTEDIAKKIGNNYILEMGKLIGEQIKLNKEEKEKRLYDLYFLYAESSQMTITFPIPTGYTLQGLEAFNMNITNSTGGFVSSASVEGNVLTIKAHKYYNHNFEDAKNWPQLVDFTEAAYTFTQQKLLLKKQ